MQRSPRLWTNLTATFLRPSSSLLRPAATGKIAYKGLAVQLVSVCWYFSQTMAELSQYLCQMQLQLQVAHGAQFMALAQIQMIAVDILFILYRV